MPRLFLFPVGAELRRCGLWSVRSAERIECLAFQAKILIRNRHVAWRSREQTLDVPRTVEDAMSVRGKCGITALPVDRDNDRHVTLMEIRPRSEVQQLDLVLVQEL